MGDQADDVFLALNLVSIMYDLGSLLFSFTIPLRLASIIQTSSLISVQINFSHDVVDHNFLFV